MANVVLNRLVLGSSSLNASDLSLAHRKRAEEAITKIFKSYVPNQEITEKTPLHLDLKPGAPVLHINDRKISLKNHPQAKKLNELIRYYQHTGIIPRALESSTTKVKSDEETRKSVEAMNQASIPGANGSIYAGARIANDSLSTMQNFLHSLPAFGPKDAIASHLGYYSGIFWSFFALREFDDGLVEYKRSTAIKDEEGKGRAESKLVSGSIVTTGSTLFLAGKICDSFAAANVAAPILGASNLFFAAGSLLSLGISIVGAVRCHKFNERLEEYLTHPTLTSTQKMRGAVQFLKDSLSLTPEERAELVEKIEKKHSDWPKEKREEYLDRKIANMTEVKVKYLKRRTSNRSIRMILEHADRILKQLDSPHDKIKGIEDASLLIRLVQKDNKIKTGLYALSVLAAIIGLVATAILAFASAGTLPFILYGISATIYLAMTVYTFPGLVIKYDENAKLGNSQ